jgi:membrane-associated phospholipid phosphatase
MTRRYWLVFFTAAALAIVAAHLLDGFAYHALAYPPGNDRDWGRLLRVIGYAPTWGIVALAFWLDGRSRDRSGRSVDAALGIVVAVAVGGILAEVLKLVVRRDRPDATGQYHFRPFADHPWSSRDFGMPSSHVVVAFAGATALSRRFPRLTPLLLALAAGCGLTRLMAQAHFLSDVVVGAFGGALAALVPRSRSRPA